MPSSCHSRTLASVRAHVEVRAGSMLPDSIHPRTMAPPMFPAPTMQMFTGRACCLEGVTSGSGAARACVNACLHCIRAGCTCVHGCAPSRASPSTAAALLRHRCWERWTALEPVTRNACFDTQQCNVKEYIATLCEDELK